MRTPPPDYPAAASLRAALRRLARSTEIVASEHNLTPRRYELLLFVQAAVETGTLATVTSLCEPLQTTQGSVTQLVEGAVRADLLQRAAIPDDRRSHHLTLTAHGQRQLRNVYVQLGEERDRLAEIVTRNFST